MQVFFVKDYKDIYLGSKDFVDARFTKDFQKQLRAGEKFRLDEVLSEITIQLPIQYWGEVNVSIRR